PGELVGQRVLLLGSVQHDRADVAAVADLEHEPRLLDLSIVPVRRYPAIRRSIATPRRGPCADFAIAGSLLEDDAGGRGGAAAAHGGRAGRGRVAGGGGRVGPARPCTTVARRPRAGRGGGGRAAGRPSSPRGRSPPF